MLIQKTTDNSMNETAIDIFWDNLLQYIGEHRVIPIIGRELLVIEAEGCKMLLEDYLAEKLAARYGIPYGETASARTLNQVACSIVNNTKRRTDIYPETKRADIYPGINKILSEGRILIPESLRKLALITHFNLFVTTSFDPLLEQALSKERPGGIQTIQYSPNKNADLPEGFGLSSKTTLFYLMGRYSSAPYYAVTDEDVLEFICTLQTDSRPKRLFDLLKESHLLIMGSNFPDWLARIFIRTAKAERLSKQRDTSEYLADNALCSDHSLVYFLKNYSSGTAICGTEICGVGGPVEFVDRLYEKWAARNPETIVAHTATLAQSPTSDMPHGAFFISYAHQDFEAAKRLKESLEIAGLDVWFDKENLDVGDLFDKKISKCIRNCSYFIPVVSRNSSNRSEGYFRREWKCAVDRLADRDENLPFILPVVIDDTPPNSDGIPDEFRKAQWVSLPGGEPTEEFISRLKVLYRDAQKGGGFK